MLNYPKRYVLAFLSACVFNSVLTKYRANCIFLYKAERLGRLKDGMVFILSIYKQRGAFPLSFIGNAKREEMFLSISMNHLNNLVQANDSKGAKLWNLSRILQGLTDIPVSFARPVQSNLSRMPS